MFRLELIRVRLRLFCICTPSANGKLSYWWTIIYSSGVRTVTIIYHARKENLNAHTLSRNPHGSPSINGIGEGEVHVKYMQRCDGSIEIRV